MVDNQEHDPIGSYFLELWRQQNSKVEMEEEGSEEAPTELDTVNSSGGFSVVLPDKLSVSYANVNLHGHDVGVVQANRPAPVKRLVYYFEMFVKNAGAKGQIAIGFTTEGFKMRRHPGWEANSYGYHGDDGMLYRGQGKGEQFGPTYTTGDTVGGGINYASQEFFFTKNGTVVGETVYKDVKGPLIPTVAVHSQNEEVRVNFGKEAFVFDLKAYEEDERAKQQLNIEKIPVQHDASHGIIRSYLLHYGYEDTLNLLDTASHTTVPSVSLTQENGSNPQESYALNHRKILRQLIRTGKIDDAFNKLREWYPQVFKDDRSAICFMLHCQKFIELVRVDKLEEAVAYGRVEFEKFFKLEELNDLLKDCAALLAYEKPQDSPVGYLLEDSQREVVADAVNAAILMTNPEMKSSQECLHSQLEKLLRQLSGCYYHRRWLNGGQGEAFQLRRLLNTTNNIHRRS